MGSREKKKQGGSSGYQDNIHWQDQKHLGSPDPSFSKVGCRYVLDKSLFTV